MASASATFSYAQAAKGQSMSRSVSQEEPSLDTQSAGRAPEQKTEQVEEDSKSKNVEETSMESLQAAGEAKEAQDKDSIIALSVEDSSEIAKSAPVKDERSRGTSPSVSSNAATKSFREDDISATPAESDSTWEKTSQNSQIEHSAEKGEEENDEKKLSTYEQAKPQMREAPVPVVNIWQKRMEDAQAKGGPRSASAAVKSEPSGFQSNHESGYKRPISKSFTSTSQSLQTEHKTQQIGSRLGAATVSSGNPKTPLTTDTSSWPTPNLAKHEDRKTSSERAEQSEKSATKPHGKEKWEKVPFVPTAVFNTPIPSRGGARGGRIGGRGGREGMARGGSVSSSTGPGRDRANSINNVETQTSINQPLDRSKARETSSTRGGVSTKPKRSSSTGAVNSRDPSSSVDGSIEKRESFGQRSGNAQHSNNTRQNSIQIDGTSNTGQPGPLDAQKRASMPVEYNGEPRFPRAERNYQARSRESAQEANGFISARERGEGRPERGGRGSWRGKSGAQSHASFSTSSHYQPPFANGKPYSEQRHHSHPTPYPAAREARHSRTNSRSQSIPNGQQFGRYGMHNVAPNGLPVLQTDVANAMSYAQQPAIMSAVPFHPYMEQVQLPAMVQMQLEYYFSVDNLCRDIFLRKNMDSQGFVFLNVLASFNRIQTLTADLNLLRWICARSAIIELRTGQDGIDRVRKAEDWVQWVMPSGERDVSAQNDGPTQLLSPRFEGFSPSFNGFEGFSNLSQNNPVSSANGFLMNSFRGEPFSAEPNGRNQFSQHSNNQTPLSADVPDFKPAQPSTSQQIRSQQSAEPEEKCSDAALASLRIYVQSSSTSDVSHESSDSGGLTNGVHVVDHDTDKDEPKVNGLKKDEHQVNGSAHHHQDMPNGVSSHEKSSPKLARNQITWNTLSADSEQGELYHEFRSRAYRERNDAVAGVFPDIMKDLYEFWSLFLVDNFNIRLYQEFHSVALEDANMKQSLVGLKRLVDFYSKSLYSDNVLADRLLADFIDLAAVEISNQHLVQERPASMELRKIWGDQSVNSANRLNLIKKINEPLKSALNKDSESP